MLHKKLRITENTTIVAVNAPNDYVKTLGALPNGVTVTTKLNKGSDFIHLFVNNKSELEKEIFKAAAALNPGGLLWISYPKISSGIQTDLTRDKGWECLNKLTMQWLSLISFDETWSAFLMKNDPPKEQSRASKDYQANQANYIDAKTKTVIIPDGLNTALKKNKKAMDLYNVLSFTNKKEYVLWVVGAKREETRSERVKKTIEKLLAGKKNPSEK